MTSPLGAAFRSFWHTMTSYDRHSDFNSPYRTASESRADITSPYTDETGRLSTGIDGGTAYMGAGIPAASPVSLTSPMNGPYSPGMRSLNAKRDSKDDGFETVSSAGDVPLQSFNDGMPPAPPVSHSWKRIDTWADENYPELFDQLCEGCTDNDLNELEHMLDCSLPQDVRDSLMIHDGQERGGRPTGIIFGCMLLDCEEMVQEWDQWRKVNHEFLLDKTVVKPATPSKALGGSSQASSSKPTTDSPSGSQSSTWREDLLSKQDSVPPGAVQRSYAHPAWIPLVRDWGGNNLGVDLAPGPTGSWGQIVLFGRDYDTKYVVAKSWASFLAVVADDLNSGKWYVDEDNGELKLREFKVTRVEPSYFDILRWRMDQKYGRGAKTAAKRKSMMHSGAASPSNSPYASPADANGEARGRTLQRLNSPSPLASPIRPGLGKSSPLARVTEETSSPSSLTDPKIVTNGIKPTKLVEVETPPPKDDEKQSPTSNEAAKVKPAATEAPSTNGNGKLEEDLEDAMKTIEI